MALIDDIQNHCKLFLMGPGKSKKTWWAGLAAEAGFNVLCLDIDEGTSIWKNVLSPEAKKRVSVINIRDTTEKAIAQNFMANVLPGNTRVIWDEQSKMQKGGNFSPDHTHTIIQLNKMTRNDVLIIDSWTALAQSILWNWCLQNNIDPLMSEAAKNKWVHYQYCQIALNAALEHLKMLKINFIIIGHTSVYEKYEEDDEGKSKPVWSRTIPISSSGPHAMSLAKHFDDILNFKVMSPTNVMIDANSYADADGGGRNLPPKTYSWTQARCDLTFEDYCKLAHIPLPDKDCPPSEAWITYPPGADMAEITGKKGLPLLGSGNGADNKVKMPTLSAAEMPKRATLTSLTTKD